jgi:hypothetical protein
MSKLQKKPAAHKRGHPTLQNMNFSYFCGSFLPSWIRIRIPNTDLDPDPLARLNTDPIRIRIRNPGGSAMFLVGWIRIRIRNADPGPDEHKLPTIIEVYEEVPCFEVLDVLFCGLKASPVVAYK